MEESGGDVILPLRQAVGLEGSKGASGHCEWESHRGRLLRVRCSWQGCTGSRLMANQCFTYKVSINEQRGRCKGALKECSNHIFALSSLLIYIPEVLGHGFCLQPLSPALTVPHPVCPSLVFFLVLLLSMYLQDASCSQVFSCTSSVLPATLHDAPGSHTKFQAAVTQPYRDRQAF